MFQQLQKLQVQDSIRIANLTPLPAKLQSSTNVEGFPSRKQASSLDLRTISLRGHSDQERLARNSRSVVENRNVGLVEVSAVKVEVGAVGSLNQGATDIFWRNNPINQANQVQFVIFFNNCVHRIKKQLFSLCLVMSIR